MLTWRFAPDSRLVLTLNRQGQVSRWSGSDYQQRESLLDIGATVAPALVYYNFSQDGRFLAAGSFTGLIQIWDLSRRVLYRRWTNTTGDVAPLSFLADGNKLITLSGSDRLLHEWDSATGRELLSWPMPGIWQGAMAVSADEQSSVIVGYEGDVVLKNLADQSQTNLNLDILEGACATYSPDGNLFAVSSDLGFARVWKAANWQPVTTIGGFANGAHSVSFSPDGKRLAIGSGGKEAVKLCDTESWQDVLTLEAQGVDFHNLAFSPDGNTIGWLTQSGVLCFWQAPSWDQIAAAEASQQQNLKQP